MIEVALFVQREFRMIGLLNLKQSEKGHTLPCRAILGLHPKPDGLFRVARWYIVSPISQYILGRDHPLSRVMNLRNNVAHPSIVVRVETSTLPTYISLAYVYKYISTHWESRRRFRGVFR